MAGRVSTQTIMGGIIVVVGLLLLLDTTGLANTSELLVYVPSLFVLLGLYAVLSSDFRNLTGPLLVVVVAGAWQLVALDLVEGADLASFWPVLIVLFGLSLLLGRLRSPVDEVSDRRVDAIAVFGGREYRVTTDEFEGGDVTALFGGIELDLRDAGMRERPVVVSATALFGGVEIAVPREWNVKVDVLPVFGGASDERPRYPEEHRDVDLVVTGFAAFGGVGVK